MNNARLSGLSFLSRIYPVAALVVAAVLLPPGYLAISLPLLGLYVYAEVRWVGSQENTLLALFFVFALPLLFKPIVGVWLSPLLVLPVIPLLDRNLRQAALRHQFVPSGKGRRPTRLCVWLAIAMVSVGVVAWALGSWGLLMSCGLLAAYLAAVIGWGLYRTSSAPATAEPVARRALAGHLTTALVKLTRPSRFAGQLRLASSYPWLSIKPTWFVVDGQSAEIEVSFTPPLAGPTSLTSSAAFLDTWGLVQTDFGLVIGDLLVIPRARYAEWLARQYLAMSRSGRRETMTSTAAAQRTTKKGIEFYGIRSYQPGDSAKTIDWKHTLKLHQMVVREFLDSGVESAIMLVNLSVSDEEEKDKLACGLIMTALTLTRESIPSVMAAYDDKGVVMTSRLLDPRQALLQALNLTKLVKVSLSPLRYLEVPDVTRLKANIHRLKGSKHNASARLAELLELEYAALGKASQSNPAAKALAAALSAGNNKANVLVVSRHNHDAEALAFATHSLIGKGYRVLTPNMDNGRVA